MFNHHPDVLHYAWRAFRECGYTVHVATEKLTKSIGFNYSSTIDNKFQVVDQLFEPTQLYPEMFDIKFVDDITEKYDIFWSMLPEITSLNGRGQMTWFDGQMQVYLREYTYSRLPGIKSANHPDAYQLNGFQFLPNWVDRQPDVIERRYVTQLITEANLVDTTKELERLDDEHKIPVKIYGGKKARHGFIRDIVILPYTSLLVHNKNFGVNCYAVCKALDMGIPVYMSRSTRAMIGFGDLPDDVFLFKDDMTIEEAYHKSQSIDNAAIQNIYRSIYTLERTSRAAADIMGIYGQA